MEPQKFTGHERDQLAGDPHTLDDMHARYYSAVLGRFLSVDVAGRYKATSRPQSWNRYAYASNNPLVRMDPDGLRDIYVAIWNDRFPYFKFGSVGHAAAFELNGKLILSQFPANGGHHGRNEPKDYQATLKYEHRLPDRVFKVHVPNDKGFDTEAARQAEAKSWDWDPDIKKSETNCSTAVGRALKAGGVPVTMFDLNYIPDDLGEWLDWNSGKPSPGQQWSVTPVANDALGPIGRPNASIEDRREGNQWELSGMVGGGVEIVWTVVPPRQ